MMAVVQATQAATTLAWVKLAAHAMKDTPLASLVQNAGRSIIVSSMRTGVVLMASVTTRGLAPTTAPATPDTAPPFSVSLAVSLTTAKSIQQTAATTRAVTPLQTTVRTNAIARLATTHLRTRVRTASLLILAKRRLQFAHRTQHAQTLVWDCSIAPATGDISRQPNMATTASQSTPVSCSHARQTQPACSWV